MDLVTRFMTVDPNMVDTDESANEDSFEVLSSNEPGMAYYRDADEYDAASADIIDQVGVTGFKFGEDVMVDLEGSDDPDAMI
jgi:hypothetical protein